MGGLGPLGHVAIYSCPIYSPVAHIQSSQWLRGAYTVVPYMATWPYMVVPYMATGPHMVVLYIAMWTIYGCSIYGPVGLPTCERYLGGVFQGPSWHMCRGGTVPLL